MKFLTRLLAAALFCLSVSASEVTTWSTTSANNNSTPPNGWPEGMQYSQVNNSAREMMGAIARWRDSFSVSPSISIYSAAGTPRNLYFNTNTLNRWAIGISNGAESGSNAGSDFYINRYNDAGAYIAGVIGVARSTGVVNFTESPIAPTPSSTDNSTKLATTQWVSTYATSGIYTPACTNIGNASTFANLYGKWIRVGNIVSLSGSLTFTSTATSTFVQFSCTLPVATHCSTENEIVGTQTLNYGVGASSFLVGNSFPPSCFTTNNQLYLRYYNTGGAVSGNALGFSVSYIVQ